jgi:hypothetical protein
MSNDKKKEPESQKPSDEGGDEAESPSNDAASALLAKRRLLAAQAIQRHFSLHPMSVIIVSMTADGKVQADITEHGSIGTMLFAQRLLNKYVDESFEKSLIQGAKPQPDPKQQDSGAV